MKFEPGLYLSEVHCADDSCPASLILFEIKLEHEQQIKDCQAFLKQCRRSYGTYGDVTLRGNLWVVVFQETDEEGFRELFGDTAELTLRSGPNDSYSLWKVTVPDIGACLDAVPDSAVWRSDCAGIRVYDNAVYVTALGKYDDAMIESACLFNELE